jgi:hypothetical protein
MIVSNRALRLGTGAGHKWTDASRLFSLRDVLIAPGEHDVRDL